MSDYIKYKIQVEASAVSNIPKNNPFLEVVRLFHDHSSRGGKIVVCGMGKAGQVGHNIATTLCSTGTPAVFLHPSEAQHGDLGVLQVNDVLLMLSNSGKTREVLEVIELSKKIYNVPVVSIVGDIHSELAKKSLLTLYTGNVEEICPLGLTPTTSTTVMMVIGDIIVTSLMQARHFTKEDYFKRHHGGYIGSLKDRGDGIQI